MLLALLGAEMMRQAQSRQKFTTRTIYLVGEQQRDTVIKLAENLPVDPKNPLEIVVREKTKVRGLDANGYYWLRLGEIAEQGWYNKRQYSKEIWHEYCRQNLMPEIVLTKDGERISKWR